MYDQLGRQRVALEATLLKPNMVISGKEAPDRAGSEKVAEKTLDCLMRTVPESVPGIVFLSGGQGDEEATENLNALSVRGREVGAPWRSASRMAAHCSRRRSEYGPNAEIGSRVRRLSCVGLF